MFISFFLRPVHFGVGHVTHSQLHDSFIRLKKPTIFCVLQCVAVCCSVLQCVAVCCSMYLCVGLVTESYLRHVPLLSGQYILCMSRVSIILTA